MTSDENKPRKSALDNYVSPWAKAYSDDFQLIKGGPNRPSRGLVHVYGGEDCYSVRNSTYQSQMQQAKQKAEAAAAVRDRQKRAVEQGPAGEEEVDEDGKVVRDVSKSAMGLLEHDPKDPRYYTDRYYPDYFFEASTSIMDMLKKN